MTFKEKLYKEHPECVHDGYIFGCRGCPVHYGYEKEKPCKKNPSVASNCARLCWGRTIPKEQKE